MNAVMALPNIIAVIALCNIVSKETKNYSKGKNLDKKDKNPVPYAPWAKK